MPTLSVEVASLTVLGETQVQPPADVPPMAVMLPQTMLPLPSVWSAPEEELQLSLPVIFKLLNWGVEVEVTDWSMEELPNKVKVLPLPCMVILLMVDPVIVELVVVALLA